MNAINDLFSAVPGVIQRQGEDMFAAMPLYKSKKTYRAVYINPDIYARLAGIEVAPSFGEMAAVLEPLFNTTVEPENGTGEVVGTAYADRQADPLDLSLAGNQGSGRAYYVGGVFNVKGEKTVLATSERRRFSDGLLEMERCIWEAVIANSLQNAISNGLNGVLAIFDMDELCEVVWRDKPVKRGKIIRMDDDGALDRITHLFYRQQPVASDMWTDMAQAFGRLEGDKFIERIIHGTWSPGNISPRGHLIDFDTVGTVKGRSPQFSSTRWHHENYFGYEYYGQLNVLKAMANDPALNVSGVDFDVLKEIMMSEMSQHISHRFVSLMGLEATAEIYNRYKEDIDALCVLWQELARKGFRKHEEMLTKHEAAAGLHLFDFSHFFRFYPLKKLSGHFDALNEVAEMSDNSFFDDPYAFADDSQRPEIEKIHLDAVYAVLGDCFVTAPDMAAWLRMACHHFVKNYDALHQKIMHETQADLSKVALRAYIVNEDRFYLFPAYTATFDMAKNEERVAPALQNKMISALVLGNHRASDAGKPIADFRLYDEGYLYRLFDDEGQSQVCFSFFNDADAAEVKAIKVGNYELIRSSENKGLYCSPSKEALTALLEYAGRENSLHFEQILLLNS